jgi:DNA-binding response OmpR family regulator
VSVGVWAPPPHAATAALLGFDFASREGGGRLRLLLVEDDRMIADMYRRSLEMDGYSVEVVSDGAAGLEALRTRSYDLALVDIRLPGVDGLQLLEESRKMGVSTPVVIVTNYSEASTRRRSEELGAVDYVVKSRVLPAWLSERVPLWVRGQKPS